MDRLTGWPRARHRRCPFGSIQDALGAAHPGDIIAINPGLYPRVAAHGPRRRGIQPITMRARSGAGTVTVASRGRVLTLAHPFVTIDGLVLDGEYGVSDLVRIETAAAGAVLRNCEVRRTSRDGIDIAAAPDVLIDHCHIHHTLDSEGGRTDAHGIVAGAVKRLTIRSTTIDTFSGDGVQVYPGRDPPGWDEVLIEGCRIWLSPLAEDVNGFRAGVVPGENAVDTKERASLPRARLTIRDTEAWGFQAGLISNMAAFNIKENVDVVIDRVTVHDYRDRVPASRAVQGGGRRLGAALERRRLLGSGGVPVRGQHSRPAHLEFHRRV